MIGDADFRSPIITLHGNEQPDGLWTTRLRSRDFLEVVITYGLVLLALWTPRPVQIWLSLVILAWILCAMVTSKQDARTLGFRPAGLRSLWIAGLALISAAIAIWVAARMHTLHPFLSSTPSGAHFLGYMLWAFLQQFLLQGFFLLRLLRLLPTKGGAVAVAALLFGFAHIPNPLLIVATLVWGAAACALFLRYRDIYSLGIAHGIFGICLAITVPSAVHHQMNVGLGYYRYHEQSAPVHRGQSNHIVSTDAWVMADATRRCLSRQARP